MGKASKLLGLACLAYFLVDNVVDRYFVQETALDDVETPADTTPAKVDDDDGDAEEEEDVDWV